MSMGISLAGRPAGLALLLLSGAGVAVDPGQAPATPAPDAKVAEGGALQNDAARVLGARADDGQATPPDTLTLYNHRLSNQVIQSLGEVANRTEGWTTVLQDPHYTFAYFRDPADVALGATLEPVGEPIRAQLALPEGQGLVVTSLTGDGPAAHAGLKERDILLRLEGKPLTKAEDLTLQLKEVGEKDVTLHLLRGGKQVHLKVRPVYRVTLGAVGEETTSYFIGVSVDAVDDTLRSQLRDLPEGQGLVANEVVAGSPAEKAGVKKHDILLKLGEKALKTTEDLVASVQDAKDQTQTLTLLRAGQFVKLEVTPEKRTVKAPAPRESIRLWSVPQQSRGFTPPTQGAGQFQPYLHRSVPYQWQASPGPAGTDKRIEDLDKEMKSLRKAVEEIRDAIKSRSDPRKPD